MLMKKDHKRKELIENIFCHKLRFSKTKINLISNKSFRYYNVTVIDYLSPHFLSRTLPLNGELYLKITATVLLEKRLS